MNKISALGLDIGNRRIGVAGCDGTGLIATGLTTIKRGSFVEDVAQLQEIVAEREVEILVSGLPYSLDGNMGPQAEKVQRFALRLGQALNLPVEFVDERYTSMEAEEMMILSGRSPSQNKALIDRKAAALILQRWLDERRQKL
jgi:putative holliday junction resolvase